MNESKRIEKITGVKKTGLFARVRANVGWSILSEVGGKGFLFICNIYLARTLQVEGYGYFSYAQTLACYFWLAVDLGINMYGSREIAKEKDAVAAIASVLITLRFVSGIAIFVIFAGSSYLLVINPQQRLVFYGCAFYLAARSINTDWIFRGLEKFKYIAIGNFSTFFFMLLVTIAVVKNGNDVTSAAFIWSLSYLFGGSILLFILKKQLGIELKPVFNIQAWYSHIKESIHFTISGGLLTLYQYLPIIYLGLFASAFEVGIFSAPYRLVVAITYAISIIPMSLYPTFSELYSKDKNRFNKLHTVFKVTAFFLGIFVLIVGNIFADVLILNLFGSHYVDSVNYFRIMLVYIFLFCTRSPFGIVIAASGFQRYYTIASATAVLFFSILLFLLRSLTDFTYPSAVSICLASTELIVSLVLMFIWHFKINTGKLETVVK